MSNQASQAQPTVGQDEPGRWLRFVGPVEVSFVGVGGWAVGEVKHIGGELAATLARHPHIEPADPPTADAQPTAEPPAEQEPVDPKPTRTRSAAR